MKKLWIIGAFISVAVAVVFLVKNYQKPQHAFILEENHRLIGFDLKDPEQAPSNIRESVLNGYHILMNTPLYLPQYAGDQLSCTNCHIAEGNTLGGISNGYSLVGVTAVYPHYSDRAKRTINLADRINMCFERSLNGRPLPTHSQEMQDIVNYLQWISQDLEHVSQVPWLGIPPLKTSHIADLEKGGHVYARSCAMCHQNHGEGGSILPDLGKTVPPVWGPHSFNDGAGMSRLETFAAFVKWNMPYEDPYLTEEEALDVAAFILQQPRPHYIEKQEQ